MIIDLIVIGSLAQPLHWSLGRVHVSPDEVNGLHHTVQAILNADSAQAVLFWDARLPLPAEDVIMNVMQHPGNLWHGGARLGLADLPRGLRFARPMWMLDAQPKTDIAFSSWRLSFAACLIPLAVLRHLNGIDPAYRTLIGAALDLGQRVLNAGFLPRYAPDLLAHLTDQALRSALATSLPFHDEYVLARAHYTRWQVGWMALRGMMRGVFSFPEVMSVWWRAPEPQQGKPLRVQYSDGAALSHDTLRARQPKITVLIPTIDRYPYLRVLLDQLRAQTLAVYEIIVVDQTEASLRDPHLLRDFADLPLHLFVMDQAGQCRSRNLGLQHSTGEYIMFLDDDDEIPPDLLERHFRNLIYFRADASSGVVYEPPLRPDEVMEDAVGVSDVFPTNVTLLRRDILHKTGLFDMAFDRLSRADHDLGMRIYLNGGLIVIDRRAPILHHHAPRGGLRQHKQRVDTRAASRHRLVKPLLLKDSSAYIGLRYHTPQEMHEALLISLITSLGITGSLPRRVLGALIALFYLPQRFYQIRQIYRRAQAMLARYPDIPALTDAPVTAGVTEMRSPALPPMPPHTPSAGSAAGSVADSSAARAGD